jgi:NAD(P)-dependent dehydrogenase (short-subunit alcohol dehydrogenase family)
VEVIKMASATRCIKRPETPDDLTGTIVFLSSDDSDFITGQTIIVDGGSALN